MKLSRYLVVLICIIFSFLPIYAEWVPMVNSYTTDVYGAGTQNWGIVQQKNGWIYAANNYGLLEYDGAGRVYNPFAGCAIAAAAINAEYTGV